MMQFDQDVAMFDLSDKKNRRMWIRRDLGIGRTRKMILTDTFCGFVHFGIEEQNVPYPGGVLAKTGHFYLKLLDTYTGKTIINEKCWDILYYILHPQEAKDFLPFVAAKGNYLFACSPYEREGPEDSETIKDAFLCVHVDPDEDMACKVARVEGELVSGLLRECVRVEHLEEAEEKEVFKETNPEPDIYIQPDYFGLLGFAFESVVVGYVTFDYKGAKAKYHNAKTVFSVELEDFFADTDPKEDFTGLHFPLGSRDVLTNHGIYNGWPYPAPDYYPHYQTTGDDEYDADAMLAGVVELFLEEDGTITPTLYSFRKTFERKDILECANDHSVKAE